MYLLCFKHIAISLKVFILVLLAIIKGEYPLAGGLLYTSYSISYSLLIKLTGNIRIAGPCKKAITIFIVVIGFANNVIKRVVLFKGGRIDYS
jgi:hypothetical protein